MGNSGNVATTSGAVFREPPEEVVELIKKYIDGEIKPAWQTSNLTARDADVIINCFRIVGKEPDYKWEENGTEYEVWETDEYYVVYSHDIGLPDSDLTIFKKGEEE